MTTYQHVPGLVDSIPNLLCLTGTPALNRPSELWTTLRALAPAEFGNFFQFGRRYCDGHKVSIGGGRTAWDFTGSSNRAELRDRVKSIMIRREKDQVLTDLPPKRRVNVDVELSNRDAYDKALEAQSEALDEAVRTHDAGSALVILNRLRQLAGEGKVEAAVEWLTDFLAGDGSVIVFAHHKAVLDQLQAAVEALGVAAVRVDGDVPVQQRQAAVDAFQAGTARVFLGTPGAAGVGLTLTHAQDVLFVEREWTPAVEEQAEDRAHRIGQAGSVTAWYLVAADSIDDKFNTLVESKRAVLKAVLAGDDSGADQDEGDWMWALSDKLMKGDDA